MWANHHDNSISLDVSEFSKPHDFALAELAFFPTESHLFTRLDKGNAIVLARDFSAVRSVGSNDPRPGRVIESY